MPGAPLSPAWRRGRVLHAVVDHLQVAQGVRTQGAELAVGELVADPVPVQRHPRSPGPMPRAGIVPSSASRAISVAASPRSAAARPSTAAGSPPRPGRRGLRSPCPPDPAPVQHHQRARPCGRRRAGPPTGTRRRRGSCGAARHRPALLGQELGTVPGRGAVALARPARAHRGRRPFLADLVAWSKGSPCNADTFHNDAWGPFRRMPC